MDESIEPSGLLLETDLISEEEKKKIIAEIDKGFLTNNQNSSTLHEISVKSNWLIIPLIISVVSIISTIIILLLFNSFLWKNNESSLIKFSTEESGSEWEMLRTYMKASTKKLEGKNVEIDQYKVEIVNYDIKLSTLRKLLIVKKDTENRLILEREKLITEGIEEEEINSQINILEESLVSELAPGMIAFYNLSIDDLNNQIDQVLDQKTESVDKLEVSIVEREMLKTENKKIQDKVEEEEIDISQLPEVIDTINKMNVIVDQYKYGKIIRNEISNLYLKIFQNMEDQDYHSALETIVDLENLIMVNNQHEEYESIEQLLVQIKIVDKLKEFANKSIKDLEQPLDLVEKNENFIDTQSVSSSQVGGVSKDMLLYGSILLIQFDHIYIEPISGFEISPGTNFHVFKLNGKDIKIGSGTITDVSKGVVSGLLDTNIDYSGFPESADLVYISSGSL